MTTATLVAPQFKNFGEYCAHNDQSSEIDSFAFIAECSGNLVGYLYRDCGLGDGFKFAPFDHGLAQAIHGADLNHTIAVLEAFQLMYSRPQLERMWANPIPGM